LDQVETFIAAFRHVVLHSNCLDHREKVWSVRNWPRTEALFLGYFSSSWLSFWKLCCLLVWLIVSTFCVVYCDSFEPLFDRSGAISLVWMTRDFLLLTLKEFFTLNNLVSIIYFGILVSVIYLLLLLKGSCKLEKFIFAVLLCYCCAYCASIPHY